MEYLFQRRNSEDGTMSAEDAEKALRVRQQIKAILEDETSRIGRSYSLPTHLVDVEEAEAVRATFRAHLASDHFTQCRCPPKDSTRSAGYIFQLMNSPCIWCGMKALYSFVSGQPIHDPAEPGSSNLICDAHDNKDHHWWHHWGKTDPEIHMTSLQIINHWGYPAEEHSVTTADGFILRLHRIPSGRYRKKTAGQRKPVVFLQHGLEGSSADWITNYPQDSLGFILADAGFDVWLGNFRGNQYSLQHQSYTVDDTEFWDFSWDQMSAYDLPAMIDFVLDETQEEALHYVGHSQGALTIFAHLSEHGIRMEKKLKSITALAPVITLRHIRGFLKYMAVFTTPLTRFIDVFGMKQFLPNNWVSKLLVKTVCEWKGTNAICSNVIFAISGPNTKQDGLELNAARLPVYLAHTPSGTSAQNICHYGQMVATGRFQKFDYGSPQENLKRYNLPFPPSYQLRKVWTPTFVFSGREDWLSTEADIATSLLPHLGDLRGIVSLAGFNHLDFIWGLRAADQIYRPITRLLLDMEAEAKSQSLHPNSSPNPTSSLTPNRPTFNLKQDDDNTSDYDTATTDA